MSELVTEITAAAKKLYHDGRKQEAFDKYLQAAMQGDVAAEAFVGQMYLLGEGTSQNDEEALKWYKAAAQKDYAPAQCSLGFFYHHKKNDIISAIEWYRKAAVQGQMTALWRLGMIYKKGIGVPVDSEQAYAYLEQAAERGHIFSQRELAFFLIKGQRGWSKMPKGLSLLAKCIVDGSKVAWKSENDERLRN